MLRVLIIFAVICVLAAVTAVFADYPGELRVSWLGYELKTSFMLGVGAVLAVVLVLLALAGLLRGLIGMPGAISGFFRTRRQMRGLEALSKGVLAAGAGDAEAAARYSQQASRILTNEPLAQLLKAQAAQLGGDRKTVKRVFESMLQDTETEALGLRGLFVQARQDGDLDQARLHAERAFALSPRLGWAARAVLALQTSEKDWPAVEATLDLCRRNKLMDTDEANRKKAVVTTARAADLEETAPERALDLALAAHKAAPDLVPAAVVAGRLLAATGQTRKAGRVLEKTWALSPHPEIAEIYAAAKAGASPKERLKRMRALVRKSDGGDEGPIALAGAAVAAREWQEAREALAPLTRERPSARVCTLMAEIEEGENGDEGRMREWLARAVGAPGDPVWTADGFTSEVWRPSSPVTGELDAFQWKVPVEGLHYHGGSDHGALPARSGRDEPETQPDDPGPDDGAPEPAEQASGPADQPKPKAAAKPEPAEGKPDEPEIYVPPRAPDDPGPEPQDEATANPFRPAFAV